MKEYTSREKELMNLYQQRTGIRLMTLEEKQEAYKKMTPEIRQKNMNGIQNAIYARLNIDNEDIFDGEDDSWKLKMLEENLELLSKQR